MSHAGYSGTPLPKKLGIVSGMRVGLHDAPNDFVNETLGDVSTGVEFTTTLRGNLDIVIGFFTQRQELERRLAVMRRRIEPNGMIWVAWPKRASKVDTDITEDVVRDVVLPTGLVDVKVCAIDEVWSGLKVVIRRELR